MLKIDALRKNYTRDKLTKEMLLPDPIQQFEQWFKEACTCEVTEPNAMSLATVGSNGQPTLRTVLLKIFDEKGFVFFTNYGSKKAHQIKENNRVSLLFPWIQMERQIIITGSAEKVSTAESARYFASRPRESQLGAWISNQSTAISSRSILLGELKKVTAKFASGQIPLPDFWGGYRVSPETIEFWQGRESRLHDRFMYSKTEGDAWKIERLAP